LASHAVTGSEQQPAESRDIILRTFYADETCTHLRHRVSSCGAFPLHTQCISAAFLNASATSADAHRHAWSCCACARLGCGRGIAVGGAVCFFVARSRDLTFSNTQLHHDTHHLSHFNNCRGSSGMKGFYTGTVG